MKIYSSREGRETLFDLEKANKEYQKVWNEHNERLNQQEAEYYSKCMQCADNLKELLSERLSVDFSFFSELDISLRHSGNIEKRGSDTPLTCYTVMLYYNPSDFRNKFEWNMHFYVYLDGDSVLVDPPIISMSSKPVHGSAEDIYLKALKDTYDFASELNNLDITSIMKDVFTNAPKYKDTVSEPKLDYDSSYKKNLQKKVIDSIIGKDLWVKVEINSIFYAKVLSVDYENGQIEDEEFWPWRAEEDDEFADGIRNYTRRLNAFYIPTPVEIVTTEDLKAMYGFT